MIDEESKLMNCLPLRVLIWEMISNLWMMDKSVNPEPIDEELAGKLELQTVNESSDFSAEDFESETAAITSNAKPDNPSRSFIIKPHINWGMTFWWNLSLDEEDERFLGECGIGIAETINSTDPKQ